MVPPVGMSGCFCDLLRPLLLVRSCVFSFILYGISGNTVSRERPVELRVERSGIRRPEIIPRVKSRWSGDRILSETFPRDHQVILLMNFV